MTPPGARPILGGTTLLLAPDARPWGDEEPNRKDAFA